jgi:hypothetical protein
MFLDNTHRAKSDFLRIEDVLSSEESIENKIVGIREVFKILFNFGVFKLSKKKSTLEEINEIKKDVGLSPILMLQSKLTSIFNSIFKGKKLSKFRGNC